MRSKLLDIMLKRVPIQRTKVASGKSDFPNRQFLVQVVEEKPLNGTQLTFGLIWETGFGLGYEEFFSLLFFPDRYCAMFYLRKQFNSRPSCHRNGMVFE